MNEQRKDFARGERVWVFAREVPGLVAQPQDRWLPAEVLEVDEDGAVTLNIQWYQSAERFDPDTDEEWWAAEVRLPPGRVHLVSQSRDGSPFHDQATDGEEG